MNMQNNKEALLKGIKTVGIAVAVIILAPILLTMGFKGVHLENAMIGYSLLVVGFVAAIVGILFFVKGIKYFLDYWFEK